MVKHPRVCRSGEIALSLKGPGMQWIQNFLRCKEEREYEGRSCQELWLRERGWTFDLDRVAAPSAPQGGSQVMSTLLVPCDLLRIHLKPVVLEAH